MKQPILLQLFVGLWTIFALEACGLKHYPPHDDRAVELNSIQSLIFRQDAKTTGRRTSAVPQMTCVGGGFCGTKYEPAVVQCTNIGQDYTTGDPTWKCTAELESGLHLGTTDVVCEGFRDRDDPWILRGSCGLEYTMQGEPVRRQDQSYSTGRSYDAHKTYSHQSTYKASPSFWNESWLHWFASPLVHIGSVLYWFASPALYVGSWMRWLIGSMFSLGSWLSWCAGIFLLWAVLRFASSSGHENVPYAQAVPPGGGYHNGNGGNWGNPFRHFGNPFSNFENPFSNYGGQGGAYGQYGQYAQPNMNYEGKAGNTGSNFWKGLGAGAGLGYLFGRRNNSNNPNYVDSDTRRETNVRDDRFKESREYANRSPSYPTQTETYAGPATQTSTGYGTTRRRG